MTEQEWLSSDYPKAMLAWLTQRDAVDVSYSIVNVSDRKLMMITDHLLASIQPNTSEMGYPTSPLHWLAGWISAAASNSDGLRMLANVIRDIVQCHIDHPSYILRLRSYQQFPAVQRSVMTILDALKLAGIDRTNPQLLQS